LYFKPADTVADVLSVSLGAYSIRTTKGYAADLRLFVDWCSGRGADWLPAAPAIVAAFVDDQVARYRISTIKRRLCAIAFAHRMRDLPTPTDTKSVRLAIRRASRQRASRPQQKRGLTHKIRSDIVAACPVSLAGLRDAALISVGYDTLCRSSELSAMLVEHLEFQDDVSGCVLIPRTKADVAGEGRLAHLSPDTVKLIRRWIVKAELKSGPLFRSLHLHRIADGPLCTSSIRRLIKRATERAGFDPDLISALSGHSMRIGAAQDMLVAGFDALAIMQAGGWKSANVVLRYVENAATKELHERRWKRMLPPT
jgi:integrase/recombinase XerD